jgi:hypothetical protein
MWLLSAAVIRGDHHVASKGCISSRHYPLPLLLVWLFRLFIYIFISLGIVDDTYATGAIYPEVRWAPPVSCRRLVFVCVGR